MSVTGRYRVVQQMTKSTIHCSQCAVDQVEDLLR